MDKESNNSLIVHKRQDNQQFIGVTEVKSINVTKLVIYFLHYILDLTCKITECIMKISSQRDMKIVYTDIHKTHFSSKARRILVIHILWQVSDDPHTLYSVHPDCVFIRDNNK